MMKRGLRSLVLLGVPLGVLALAPCAHATFHLMQIHQVVGGVDGDTSAQAIQLRMRAPLENLVSNGKLIAWDAGGANPIVLIDIPADVPNDGIGVTVLLATASFSTYTSPHASPDFVLTNPLPASYLTAGSITFENDLETILVWRLSWGGAGYTGPTTGSLFNDADGDYGPPYAGPVPSGGLNALEFTGPADALSTTNEADYALTADPPVFTNNAGESFTLVNPTGVRLPEDPAGLAALSRPRAVPNPFHSATRLRFHLSIPSETRLVITDVRGRRVDERRARLPAGTHSFEWSGTDAHGASRPSGVYFYRLEGAGTVRTGRLVLVR